ncbi:ABC transporter ATP-binding protein [Marinospirillum insulare]|uniref:ABC transporter ATP-binding protein n=1 Tax=Marinospirillum insulare TaxID=217169 RepID=A0ABQ5ZXY8_9GAMM|nr:ABC transporter ATP-binding protein [Marinospirillum insulare]GLR65065.1 ABC transporter ATP-binding protein [Marinospirillum insulare]
MMQTEDLIMHLPGRPKLDALNWQIQAGQSWGILGPNGSGKTTLLLTLAGLKAPRSGQILLAGQPITGYKTQQRAQKLGLVFQQQQDDFPATVLATALMGRHPYLRSWQTESQADISLAQQALAQMELTALANRSIQTLSGGERQRLALAVLLTQNPDLLLLDEPTNHLDLHHQMAVLELIHQQVSKGKSAVMALHDLNLAARFCSHILLLYPDGQACWGEKNSMLQLPALEKLYHQRLITTQVEGQQLFFPYSPLV